MAPNIGAIIWPSPRNILKIPQDKSLIVVSAPGGYRGSTDSIISGREGMRINGSMRPWAI